MAAKTKTFYFPSENIAEGFMRGLEEAGEGSTHSPRVGKSIDYPGQYYVSWITEDAREEEKVMAPAEYVELQGSFCPVCRSQSFSTGVIHQLSGMTAIQKVTCCISGCEATWDDIYEIFTSIRNPERGRGF